MGLLDDDDLLEIAKLKEEANKFKPQELTEGNVQAIFNRCLAKEGEPFYNVQVLTPGIAKNPSEIFQMSRAKLKENGKNIRYLVGQLKTLHIPDVEVIVLQQGFFRYDNYVWTEEFDYLFQLYALGLVGACFRGFGKTKDGTIASLLYYDGWKPTLSPKDPDFPAWWEAHKSEWEDEQ